MMKNLEEQHTQWENLVKKQLKSEEIYTLLTKENLENIEVNPVYFSTHFSTPNLPKTVESTHLVAPNFEIDEDIFATLYTPEAENSTEKHFFYDSLHALRSASLSKENTHFSLIDVFSEHETCIDEDLGIELLNKNLEKAITIDLSLHQNSGASLIQQLGIALAKTKELIEFFGEKVLSKIMFKIAVGHQYFFEIAKIRALKLLFNQLSKEYNQNLFPFIWAENTLRNKSKLDADNNLIRSTLEITSAMIGGADAVFSKDYQWFSSTENTREIAFKQQIVLAYESIINVFEDAGNGSFFIESCTKQLANKAWAYFLEIEDLGGYLKNTISGKIQKEIYDHAVKEQLWVEQGKIKLLGVNLYPQLEPKMAAKELYCPHSIRAVRWAEQFE